MSRFLSAKYAALIPYTPGEQPKDARYVKLNTNESPYPPSPMTVKYIEEAAGKLNLYCDPECTALREEICRRYEVGPDEVILTNGSDEALGFAFMAFCDSRRPAVFPDITYGFYPVFARLNGVPYGEIPLNDRFEISVSDYIGINKTIFIPNPNAPTGIALTLSEIEEIVRNNPENVVVIDEAYVDFGAQSALKLIKAYDNLVVTMTFSKSRSMAGARLGMAFACPALIRDLNTIKYSTNPYNVNAMTQAAGVGTLRDDGYTKENCQKIQNERGYLSEELRKLGFILTPSAANFVFAKHPAVGGEALYLALKERGVLVRHFGLPRIADYNRITVGTREESELLLAKIKDILGGIG